MSRPTSAPAAPADPIAANPRLRRIQQALEQKRQQLLDEGAIPIEPNRRDDGQVGQDEDGQPLNEMHQAISSSRNRARAGSLAQIDAALHRLRSAPDEFGLCQECEEPIEERRLEIMPHAELCVECQDKQDGPRHPTTRRHLTDYR